MDALLEKIRVNSILLSNAHKERFVELKGSLKYYKIPVIVISGVSALISVAQAFISQEIITVCNGLFGLCCSIIVSIELYLGISAQLAQSSSLTKEFYTLSTDIFKTLSLNPENRTENSLTYLESVYGTYTSLCANSYIIVKQLDDRLLFVADMPAPPDRRSSTAFLNYLTNSQPTQNRHCFELPNNNNNHTESVCNSTEGFTGVGTYGGAVKLRSSVDVDELRSSKSMDDDVENDLLEPPIYTNQKSLIPTALREPPPSTSVPPPAPPPTEVYNIHQRKPSNNNMFAEDLTTAFPQPPPSESNIIMLERKPLTLTTLMKRSSSIDLLSSLSSLHNGDPEDSESRTKERSSSPFINNSSVP